LCGSSSLKLVETKIRPKILNLSLNESPLKKVFVHGSSQNSPRNANLTETNYTTHPTLTAKGNIIASDKSFGNMAPPQTTILFRSKQKKLQ